MILLLSRYSLPIWHKFLTSPGCMMKSLCPADSSYTCTRIPIRNNVRVQKNIIDVKPLFIPSLRWLWSINGCAASSVSCVLAFIVNLCCRCCLWIYSRGITLHCYVISSIQFYSWSELHCWPIPEKCWFIGLVVYNIEFL